MHNSRSGRVMRAAFAAAVSAVAIGSLVVDLRVVDIVGPGLALTGLPALSFAMVGSFLVLRRAGGPIGWLIGAAGALFQLAFAANTYGPASLVAGAVLPGGELALLIAGPIWLLVAGSMISALVLFPDGRPPGRTFAILLWALAAALAIGFVGSLFADIPIVVAQIPQLGDTQRWIPNPLAVRGPLGALMLVGQATARIAVLPLMFIAPVALVVRFRRSRGIEREQLKWLTFTAAFTFGLLLISFSIPEGTVRSVLLYMADAGMALLPVAIAIAVTRYRLYDIDVLIRRTVLYGAISATAVATYLGAVVLLQSLLRPFTSGNELAVTASTLLVVALFQPIRSRIQKVVDRRFYRSKYDAERSLDAFAGRLREVVDLAALESELVNAVRATVQPAHVSVWLRPRPRDGQSERHVVRRSH